LHSIMTWLVFLREISGTMTTSGASFIFLGPPSPGIAHQFQAYQVDFCINETYGGQPRIAVYALRKTGAT
ncbi:hypothetical protein, partial [Gluconobacter kondonii]|uniref:hypothetical protein n=1 Tax=Gluconobacter kondonii TaxID=941463 RepID=UPI001C3F99BD